MKDFVKWPMAILLAVILTACGNNNDNAGQNNATDDTVNNGEVSEDANTTGSDQNNVNDDANGNGNGENMNGIGEGNNYSFSMEAAEQVSAMDEVENATVLRMGNNAYVGVALTEGTNESEELTNRITEAVKSVETDVEQVYVSADLDFYEEVRGYQEQYDAGDPVEGFFEGMDNAVQRVFPDANQQ